MKDILQQIQNLKEDFSSILEDAVRKAERRNLDKTIKADHKEVKDLKKNIKDCWRRHSHYSSPSQDSEKINNERMGHVKKLKDTITKGNEKLLKRDELNKREAKEAGKEQLATDKAQSNKFSLTSESSDILQQIQSLKEDFMNLIEVEGLGQPASDVPPSTNKIKKDKKTKNGRVELVSVEDELFPYDGNKREQYRQKIIDTINGMIQGTATLEDLLQIVRQKKMPVKESMEVLEELIAEKKTHVFLKQDLDDAKTRKLKKENPGILYAEDEYLDLDGSRADLKKRILAAHKEGNSEKLEEALKLLEGWAKDKRPEAAKKSIDGRRKEYLNKLANVLDAADIYGSENVPDGDVKDLDRAEGRYAHAKKVSKIEEALKLLEGLFVNDGRKDFFQHDVAGIDGTGVDAIRKITKQTFGRTKKV